MQQVDNLRAAVVMEAAAVVPTEHRRRVRHVISDPIEPQVAAKMVADADVGWSEGTARTRLSAMAATGELASNGKIGTREVRYSLAGVEALILHRKEERADKEDRV